jgi:hypothetical protein
VNGQLYALAALPLEKELSVSTRKWLGGKNSNSGRVAKRKISASIRNNEFKEMKVSVKTSLM